VKIWHRCSGEKKYPTNDQVKAKWQYRRSILPDKGRVPRIGKITPRAVGGKPVVVPKNTAVTIIPSITVSGFIKTKVKNEVRDSIRSIIPWMR